MKKNCISVFVFCLAVFLLFTSVPIATAREAGPVYVGVFGGYVRPSDLRVEDGGSTDVGVKDSWAIGAKVGYIFPQARWFAVELEYLYLAEQDVDKPGFDGDFKAHNVMANVLARAPEGIFHPYFGFGIGWSWGVFKGSSTDASGNGLAWQILAGLNFEITPNWSADLAYRYIRTKYNDIGSEPSQDITTKNNLISLGINYHF